MYRYLFCGRAVCGLVLCAVQGKGQQGDWAVVRHSGRQLAHLTKNVQVNRYPQASVRQLPLQRAAEVIAPFSCL
jgi:hypothetical protein